MSRAARSLTDFSRPAAQLSLRPFVDLTAARPAMAPCQPLALLLLAALCGAGGALSHHVQTL